MVKFYVVADRKVGSAYSLPDLTAEEAIAFIKSEIEHEEKEQQILN